MNQSRYESFAVAQADNKTASAFNLLVDTKKGQTVYSSPLLLGQVNELFVYALGQWDVSLCLHVLEILTKEVSEENHLFLLGADLTVRETFYGMVRDVFVHYQLNEMFLKEGVDAVTKSTLKQLNMKLELHDLPVKVTETRYTPKVLSSIYGSLLQLLSIDFNEAEKDHFSSLFAPAFRFGLLGFNIDLNVWSGLLGFTEVPTMNQLPAYNPPQDAYHRVSLSKLLSLLIDWDESTVATVVYMSVIDPNVLVQTGQFEALITQEDLSIMIPVLMATFLKLCHYESVPYASVYKEEVWSTVCKSVQMNIPKQYLNNVQFLTIPQLTSLYKEQTLPTEYTTFLQTFAESFFPLLLESRQNQQQIALLIHSLLRVDSVVAFGQSQLRGETKGHGFLYAHRNMLYMPVHQKDHWILCQADISECKISVRLGTFIHIMCTGTVPTIPLEWEGVSSPKKTIEKAELIFETEMEEVKKDLPMVFISILDMMGYTKEGQGFSRIIAKYTAKQASIKLKYPAKYNTNTHKLDWPRASRAWKLTGGDIDISNERKISITPKLHTPAPLRHIFAEETDDPQAESQSIPLSPSFFIQRKQVLDTQATLPMAKPRSSTTPSLSIQKPDIHVANTLEQMNMSSLENIMQANHEEIVMSPVKQADSNLELDYQSPMKYTPVNVSNILDEATTHQNIMISNINNLTQHDNKKQDTPRKENREDHENYDNLIDATLGTSEHIGIEGQLDLMTDAEPNNDISSSTEEIPDTLHKAKVHKPIESVEKDAPDVQTKEKTKKNVKPLKEEKPPKPPKQPKQKREAPLKRIKLPAEPKAKEIKVKEVQSRTMTDDNATGANNVRQRKLKKTIKPILATPEFHSASPVKQMRSPLDTIFDEEGTTESEDYSTYQGKKKIRPSARTLSAEKKPSSPFILHSPPNPTKVLHLRDQQKGTPQKTVREENTSVYDSILMKQLVTNIEAKPRRSKSSMLVPNNVRTSRKRVHPTMDDTMHEDTGYTYDLPVAAPKQRTVELSSTTTLSPKVRRVRTRPVSIKTTTTSTNNMSNARIVNKYEDYMINSNAIKEDSTYTNNDSFLPISSDIVDLTTSLPTDASEEELIVHAIKLNTMKNKHKKQKTTLESIIRATEQITGHLMELNTTMQEEQEENMQDNIRAVQSYTDGTNFTPVLETISKSHSLYIRSLKQQTEQLDTIQQKNMQMAERMPRKYTRSVNLHEKQQKLKENLFNSLPD